MLKTKVRVVDTTARDAVSIYDVCNGYDVQVQLWWLPFVWITCMHDIPDLRSALLYAHRVLPLGKRDDVINVVSK